MRRLPVYFLIDVSESMIGTPVEQVQEGMRAIIQNLRVDPYALETVFVSIIIFAGKARVLSPLTELYKFYPPVFPVGGGTSLGKGLDCLMDDIDKSVQRTTLENKGDWKPIIFLFTDGNPTDNYSSAFRRWNDRYRRHCSLVAVSIGDNVNVAILSQITDDVLRLRDTDADSFRKFFRWVTASITSSSVSVCDRNSDGVKLAPTSGINLEKIDPRMHHDTPDENFVVLYARCQTTERDYLVKYSRRTRPIEGAELFSVSDYRLVGAYPIDKDTYAGLSDGRKSKVNTTDLIGMPVCPCCGNQLGIVVCDCGNLFCVGDSENNRCPWCGMQGTLGKIAPGGLDLSRGMG